MRKGKVNAIMVGVWVALVLALAGSLRQVAWAFSTLEGGEVLPGYVKALAVDLGLAILALSIQQRRRQRRGTAVLWIGVGLFSAISVYANLLFGLVHQQALDAGELAAWRPVLLSAVLPVLVIYLSEVAGSDVNYTVRLAEREERRRARRASSVESRSAFPMPIEQARAIHAEQRARTKEEIMDAMLAIWREEPAVGATEMGRRVGRSRTTMYTYLGEMEEAGRLSRKDGLVLVHEPAGVPE